MYKLEHDRESYEVAETVQKGRPGGRSRCHDDYAAVSQAIPAPARAKMEAAFQTDFSDVRIHEGAHAAELGALAFTRGRDIHFAPGQYQPHTPAGQELLGHELAHVVQQSQGRVAGVQTKNGAINAAPALEREADELGRRAAGYSGPPAAELAFLDAPTHTPVQLQADPHQRITTFDGRISVYDKKNGDKQFKLKKGTRVNA